MKSRTFLVFLVPTLWVGTQALEALPSKIYHKGSSPLVKHSQARAWEQAYGGFSLYELTNNILERVERQFRLSEGRVSCPSCN